MTTDPPGTCHAVGCVGKGTHDHHAPRSPKEDVVFHARRGGLRYGDVVQRVVPPIPADEIRTGHLIGHRIGDDGSRIEDSPRPLIGAPDTFDAYAVSQPSPRTVIVREDDLAFALHFVNAHGGTADVQGEQAERLAGALAERAVAPALPFVLVEQADVAALLDYADAHKIERGTDMEAAIHRVSRALARARNTQTDDSRRRS